ncbi:MAG: NAD(P)H-dependent oxidoreductase [Planctomycetes bacterium]|nr:NAD(P)H-dependent oxidoreductase [Planctomycetota bacterium]
MSKTLIINTHQAYPFSEGKLNKSLVEKADECLSRLGYEIKHTDMVSDYDIDEEIDKHIWADSLILQIPVNWMSVPWPYKKYMDEVYTSGIDGRLSDGDGRSTQDSSSQYGSGGKLKGKKYMFSLTLNAPLQAFNESGQYLFQGKSIDDLFFHMHMNFRFFGMEALETFVCTDVMKNPQVQADFERYEKHLQKCFSALG